MNTDKKKKKIHLYYNYRLMYQILGLDVSDKSMSELRNTISKLVDDNKI